MIPIYNVSSSNVHQLNLEMERMGTQDPSLHIIRPGICIKTVNRVSSDYMLTLNKIKIRYFSHIRFRYQQFDICRKMTSTRLYNLRSYLAFIWFFKHIFKLSGCFTTFYQAEKAFMSVKWISTITLSNWKFCFCIILSCIY